MDFSKNINRVKYKILHCTVVKFTLLLLSKIIPVPNADRESLIIALFDTSLYSHNIGDIIIMDYCQKQLSVCGFEINNALKVPTHYTPDSQIIRNLLKSNRKFLCGTNILESDMIHQQLFSLPPLLSAYRHTILMGVGWNNYSCKPNLYTRLFYHYILDKKFLHAVRDEYTADMLKKIGISNVLFTACPTMWNLTPEFCRNIPSAKAKNVITTLTDYSKSPEEDRMLLEVLRQSYDIVYFWIQGAGDADYLKVLEMEHNVEIIEGSIEAYDHILTTENDLDYVGTRLHGGIRALNYQHRALIVSIDNRAREIAKSTNIQIFERNEIEDGRKLRKCIYSEIHTEIHLPQENIFLWKSQFSQ